MHVSKFALILFISLAAISTLVAKIQNIIYIENEIKLSDRNKSNIANEPYPGDRNRHLFWFMQISDLHLSVYNDLQRGPDFAWFCQEVVGTVNPALVLATGDLTDARTSDHLGSRQYIQEWKMYRQILNDTDVTSRTIWLDIRGNHDNFDLISSSDPKNYYRQYSIQGPQHARSYTHTIQHDTETYTFIGLDACVEPGPKRPFNFLGVLNETDMRVLTEMKLAAEKVSNYTIWFGHYPTSTISSPLPGVRELMRNSGPYLCGHLHTLGGMVPAMYTLQNTGALELELGDFKDNRRFRVIAIDHGLLSFEDYKLGEWPLVLVTNPKAALYSMPTLEPLDRVSRSTHIRVLIFSPYGIMEARVRINNGPWLDLKQSSEEPSLFTLRWNPKNYSEGLHSIFVYTKDGAANEVTKEHVFSLDGSRPSFSFGGRLALMGHISVGQLIFSASFLLIVIPFCLLRLISHYNRNKWCLGHPRSKSFALRWGFKLHLLVNADSLFWPLVILAFYVAIGPWFIGELVTGYIGICFAWGIFLNGTFLPGALTFLVGALYFQTYFFPLVLLLAQTVYLRWMQLSSPGMRFPQQSCSMFCYQMGWTLFALWQFFWLLGCLLSYGWMAFLLGFGSTWSAPISILLWRRAQGLMPSQLGSFLTVNPS